MNSLQQLRYNGFVAFVVMDFAFPVHLCLQAKLPSFSTTAIPGNISPSSRTCEPAKM